MGERRRFPRYKILKSGTIRFNDGSETECTIRDLSVAGACLETLEAPSLPESFELILGSDGRVRLCTVAWKNAKRLGVVFGEDIWERLEDEIF
jgi:hypothetical protein